MQEQLTSADDAVRSRGVTQLAEALRRAPECVTTDGELAHLCDFFSARMSDW